MNFSNCQQPVRTEQSLNAGGQSMNSGDACWSLGSLCAQSISILPRLPALLLSGWLPKALPFPGGVGYHIVN